MLPEAGNFGWPDSASDRPCRRELEQAALEVPGAPAGHADGRSPRARPHVHSRSWPGRADQWFPRSVKSAMHAVAARMHVSPGRGGRRTELVRCLPRLREALERERAFRVEQLSSMAMMGPARRDEACTPADIARAQVDEQVAAGAGRALADIETALMAIRTGRYGRCAGCDEEIAVEVLCAVPQTRWCLTCHCRRAEQRRMSSGDGV